MGRKSLTHAMGRDGNENYLKQPIKYFSLTA